MTNLTQTTLPADVSAGGDSAAVPKSLYEQALGPEFDRLHPRMKQRFGFTSADRVAHIGRGVMHTIERSSRLARPFLDIGAARNILFPESGVHVPFMIQNFAYVDSFGRETMTWHRTFWFPRRSRIFEATMVFDAGRKKVVDYLGTHQHIAADLDAWVDDDGGMNFTSGDMRFYEGAFGFRMPTWFTGQANVREWWDEELGRYRIDVHVHNRMLGTVLRYQGSFDLEIVPIVDERDIPRHVRPVREERRR